MTELPVFDLTAPLPTGRLAIEASAGTGKTFTLAGLTVRYLAEGGLSPSSLLIVTFTRAATAELRGRIRSAIVEAIDYLRSVRAGGADTDTADDVPDHLRAIASADLDHRLANLERSLTEYDSLTITTIHSFATQTINSLGSTAALDPPREFASDSAEALVDVASDVLVRAAANGIEPTLLPGLGDLTSAISTAMQTPDVIIEPDEIEDTDEQFHVLAQLVRDAITLLRLRRAQRGELSFDDVLSSLRDTIVGPDAGTLVESLRSRYRVAMIDEFQDTDPVQWTIFDSVFDHPDSTLIMVGDPKQSIYSFRGADIDTYVAATTAAGTVRTALGTNYRSDPGMLAALETLLTGTTYGPGIGFVPVSPADRNAGKQVASVDGAPSAPLRLRLALGATLQRTGKTNKIQADSALADLMRDLIWQIREALDTTLIPDGNHDDGTARHRAVKPSDIGVLVGAGHEAETIQRLLANAGIPSVLSRSGRVLNSPAADEWRGLLDALVRPSDPLRARRFAVGWFGNLSVDDIDHADDATMAALFDRLRGWLETLRDHGVAEFVRSVLDDSGVLSTLLVRPDGDRSATDLLHLGELLQTESAERRPSVATLLELIRPSDVKDGEEGDVTTRRVETQESAVQIMTVWVSKGLEFPIVMVPTMFTARSKDGDVLTRNASGTRVFHVAHTKAPEDRLIESRQRAAAERLRLLYVAVTRASHQCILWWGTPKASEKSPVSRVLWARTEGLIDPEKYLADKVAVPQDDSGLDEVHGLAERSNGMISVELFGARGNVQRRSTGSLQQTERATLTAAVLDRDLPRATSRWSFSAIAASESGGSPGGHGDPADDSLGDAGAADEPGAIEVDIDGTVIESATIDSMPMAWLGAGAQFGTLVHGVYENVDFTVDDLDAEIRRALDDELSWRFVDLTPKAVFGATHDDGMALMVRAIRLTIETPLGPLFDDAPMRRLHRSDRLDELSFELLLRPGVEPLDDRRLGATIASHIAEDEPLGQWARQLAAGRFNVDLAGHLTGSIDAIFRVRRGGFDRFVVCDYKTNRLGQFDAEPTPSQYHFDAMTEAMAHHHYPLQSLLYSVALHRYLRSRLADYDPSIHLGGVGYLFVRGMTGTEAPVIDGHRCGVWSWEPPAQLIIDLSDLLAGVSEVAS